MAQERVQVFKDSAGEWTWHRKAGNNEITSKAAEGYKNKQHAVDQARELNPGVNVEIFES